ncbi:15-hydroxyprostaglandin dehydrogenase [NAD(+)]-like [Bombus fervidus]|uniref:15-hydroxyprostaglandin dehydrogenase [NAD(+)]-like n=1 Tax=Bombus fervidus TaxID=203811 RepID=UPI003AB60EC7
MNNIQNKTVLITGGGSGLGLIYAERLLQDGAKTIAIIDLENSSVQVAVSQLELEFGKGTAKYFPCDVSNAEQFEATFKKVWDTLGGLDILINNAGLLNDRKWQRTIGVNINGVIQGSLLALDYMGKHKGGKGGTIVNIASTVALKIFSEMPIYCTSKHTVLAFSRCIQEYFDKTGVRILVLCPGATATALLDEITEKSLDFVGENAIKTVIESMPIQSTQHVGRGMIQFLLKGENGAVWVIENKQPPYAVEFPPCKKVEVKLENE